MPFAWLKCCGGRHADSDKPDKMVDRPMDALTSPDMERSDSLTSLDKQVIKDTGDVMFNQLHSREKGEEFLISFFKTYPHNQRFFKAFKGISPDELQHLPSAGNHGRRVMEQIEQLVTHIDDPEYFRKQVVSLQARHRPRKVSARQFKDMLMMFMEFTRQSMGSKFSTEHELAWQKFTIHFLCVVEEVSTAT